MTEPDRLVFVVELSLSRLNHRLPRAQTPPEVVQSTAEFHHEIADTFFSQADAIFDDTTALDATVDMLDPQPTVVQDLVGPFLLHSQLLAAKFLRWHQALDLGEREGQEAQSCNNRLPAGICLSWTLNLSHFVED
jgi:hypothetical protein